MSGTGLKAGDILVAHPSLGFDPEFGGAVIVILAHGHSTVGVNVASGHITTNLFKGGPLKMPLPVALHRVQDSIASSRPVGDSGYALTELDSYATSNALMAKQPQKAVILAGYAGWSPGQLEGEISKGLWKKVEGLSVEEVLSAWPKERWQMALDRASQANPPKPQNTAPKP